MKIQFNDLTAEFELATDRNGSERYEVTSVTDASGTNVPTSPDLLDQIEEAIEDHLLCERFEEAYCNGEVPHLLMRLF